MQCCTFQVFLKNPNMNNYFTLLPELPRVPDWIVNSFDLTSRPDDSALRLYAKPENWQQQDYKWIVPTNDVHHGRRLFEPEVMQWLVQNISDNFNTKNAGWVFFDRQFPPHCDVTRDWVLLYNLQVGGPDAEICFYQQRGHELINVRGVEIEDTDELEELVRIPGPPLHIWYLVNSQVVHGVRNQTETRLNLQLGFDIGITPNILKEKK